MTADPDLLDEMLRLGAAAGVELEVAQDVLAARRGYTSACLVLLGADAVSLGMRARVPRRRSVVIVAPNADSSEAWDCAYDIGAEHVAVLPLAEKWLVERLGRAQGERTGTGRVMAVVGGRGGAGASVLAAGLCVTAARSGLRTLLVDGDPLGGGADLLFGWEEEHGLRWPQLAEAGGRLDSQALVAALPSRGDLVVLSCDRAESAKDRPADGVPAPSLPAEVMRAALDAGRAGRDLVVVDLPRRFDEAAECALRSADRALLVVPAELRAAAAAAKVAGAALAHRYELSVVVRGPAPGRLNASEIAGALGLPLAGRLRSEPRIAGAIERGEPPAANAKGPLAIFCRRLIEEVMA
ncbi:septum site-determining protein Ssd [Rhizocola hellebori]|nr:septum site-determining protein Ssd [Rhizocola hellebori]